MLSLQIENETNEGLKNKERFFSEAEAIKIADKKKRIVAFYSD